MIGNPVKTTRNETHQVRSNELAGRALPGKRPLWERQEGEPPPPEKQGAWAHGWEILGNLASFTIDALAPTNLDKIRVPRDERNREIQIR